MIDFYFLSRITFNAPKFLGHTLQSCTTSFRIFQRFSIGLRSREFVNQWSLSKRHVCLHFSHILDERTSSMNSTYGTLSIK